LALISPALNAQTTQGGTCPSSWKPKFKVNTTLYPFTSRCIDLGYGTYHYIDESPVGTPKGTVLMVHGNPTWSFLYRNVASMLLAEGYRVIAPDNYGFGLSDYNGTTAFTPDVHAAVLTKFVQALQLQNVTLVVQDWGGSIGLTMAEQLPGQVKNMLIMNTWDWPATDNSTLYYSLNKWGINSTQNRAAYIATGLFVNQTGTNIATNGINQNLSPIAQAAIQNAYWAPFLNTTTGKPLTPTVATPTMDLANNIVYPRFFTNLKNNFSILTSKPVYFLFGFLDPTFGALTPRPNGCAPGTTLTRINRVAYCLDNSTKSYVYPFLNQFCSLWDPSKVYGSAVSQSSSHFIQEYIPETIVQAVDTLNNAQSVPVSCLPIAIP
jgi:pimeloyl-ACP methyl ester carboxylesterase